MLWRHVQILQLTTNICLNLLHDPSADIFSRHSLEMGNGKVPIDRIFRQFTLPDFFLFNLNERKEKFNHGVFPKTYKSILEIMGGLKSDLISLQLYSVTARCKPEG